jgi:cytochrome c oxidase subunit 2
VSLERAQPLADFLAWFNDVLHTVLYLPAQASSNAARVDQLQALEFTSFWIIGIAVLGTAGWCAVRYARRRAPGPTPRVTAPLWLEALLVCGLLGMFIAFWLIGFGQYVEMAEPPSDAMDVYVTGRQWVWQFGYADGPGSAGMLVVPVDRPVRLLITSRDVIHSVYVPAFRLKMDALPGRFTTAWFTADRLGRFDVFCAELCGTEHSRMRAEVVVLSADDFARWLTGTTGIATGGPLHSPPLLRNATAPVPPPPERLATVGMRVAADQGCLRCHTTDGTAHIGPTWQGLWHSRQRMRDGAEVVADAAYITESMMDPEARIVAGYDDVMPSYQGRITPAETAAIIELIRGLQFGSVGTAPPNAGVALRTNAAADANR